MRIAVIGIGGIGGYFGGKLARHFAAGSSMEIVFIARGEHLRRIQTAGLEQITTEGTYTVHPHKAVQDPSGIGRFDIVLFCVKRYGLADSAELIRKNVGPGTVLISLLNGVDNPKVISGILPEARVLNGCVYIGAQLVKPGVVRQSGGSCQLFFGPEDGCMTNLKEIESVFVAAGIKATLKQDIRTAVWEKYLFVSPLASATTYLKKPMGAFVEESQDRLFLEGLVREVAAVGNAENIPVSEAMIQAALDKIALFPYETKTSLQMDFEKGKQTEIELFTGYVVKSGKRLGVATPLHERVYTELVESEISEADGQNIRRP